MRPWKDSGPLTPPTRNRHNAYAAIDPAGHAAAVYVSNFTTVVSINHSGPGAGWSPPVTVYGSQSMLLSGLAIDQTGRATVSPAGVQSASPEAAAVNAAGRWIVIFSAYSLIVELRELFEA